MDLNRATRACLAVCIAAFPVLACTVKHGASAAFIAMAASGLPFVWSEWRRLQKWEKSALGAFLLFFLAEAATLAVTEDLKEGVKMLEKSLRLPLAILVCVAIRRFKVNACQALLYGMPVAGLCACVQSIIQIHVCRMPRAAGAYHPIVFGEVTIWIGAVLFCALLTECWPGRGRLLCLLGLAASVCAGVQSGSRGAWLFVPVMLVPLALLPGKPVKLGKLCTMGMLLCLLIPVAHMAASPRAQRTFLRKLRELTSLSAGGTPSAQFPPRICMWRDSIRLFSSSPLWGTGIGDLKAGSEELIGSGEAACTRAFSHAHNIFIDALARTGLLGFSCLVAFLFVLPFSIFYRSWRVAEEAWDRFSALGGMMTLLAFGFFGLTEGWLARMVPTTTFALSVTVFLTSAANVLGGTSHPDPARPSPLPPVVGGPAG